MFDIGAFCFDTRFSCKITKRMSIRPVNPDLQKKLEEELHEVGSRRQDDINHIKEWLKKQPHLLKVRTDDYWITVFLRGCKYSLERTKEKYDMFYTMRALCPEMFTKRDPFAPEIQKALNLGLMLPLPDLATPGGPRIIFSRNTADPYATDPITLMKVNFMITDILLEEDDNYVIAGSEMVMDMKGITMAHMTQWSPSLMKKMTTCFQEAYPVRPKGFNYINISPIFDTLFNLFKPFLNEKMKQRLYVHSDMDSLARRVPVSILPKDYGGKGPSLEELTVTWKAKVESYKKFFEEDAKYCSDESKRIGKRKSADEYFGIEGSFRKLNVD